MVAILNSRWSICQTKTQRRNCGKSGLTKNQRLCISIIVFPVAIYKHTISQVIKSDIYLRREHETYFIDFIEKERLNQGVELIFSH